MRRLSLPMLIVGPHKALEGAVALKLSVEDKKIIGEEERGGPGELEKLDQRDEKDDNAAASQ